MKRRLGSPMRSGDSADTPAVDQRICVAVSLGLDECKAPEEVQDRILQRVLRAVGRGEAPPSDELQHKD